MQTEKTETLAERLLAEAGRLLDAQPEAQQAIVTATKTGELLGYASPDWTEPAPEEAFLRTLRKRGDTAPALLVCLWQEGRCPDVPSMRLRSALLAQDAGCAETQILLRGEEGYVLKPLRVTMH